MLASFNGGGPVLLERRLGQGRMLWFTSTCDRDWSGWTRSRLYLPLVHQMLRYWRAPQPGVFNKGMYHQVININPRESEMERCTPDEFAARYQFELNSDRETKGDDAESQLASVGDLRPDEIWHWVLLCLLAVLFGECFLANRTTA